MGRIQRIGPGLVGIGTFAFAGVVWRAWTNGVFSAGHGVAYEPWHRQPDGDGPISLVHSAILAANAHNTQPWQFAITGNTITLYADYQRHLGSFDPLRREMHLSVGCALENLVHAARAQGLGSRIDAFPGRLTLPMPAGVAEPVATLQLLPADPVETDLFRAIPNRHTHRGAYQKERPVPASLLDEMHALVSESPPIRLLLFTGQERTSLGELITAATEAIVSDRQMAEDNARWFRFDPHAITFHRDGLTLDATVVSPMLNAAAKMLPPSSAKANRQWLADTRDVHVATAPLLGMIAVRDLYDRPTALAAGRLWQRLHLLVTARGLVAQPLNQPAERVDRELELSAPARTAGLLAKITGDPSWLPTFIFRIGYASRPARLSPRRPIEAVIAS